MGVVLKTLCLIAIPAMLVSFVVSARTDHPGAGFVFLVTLVVTGSGLLNIASEYAWPGDEDQD